jgi:hypothetical protein
LPPLKFQTVTITNLKFQKNPQFSLSACASRFLAPTGALLTATPLLLKLFFGEAPQSVLAIATRRPDAYEVRWIVVASPLNERANRYHQLAMDAQKVRSFITREIVTKDSTVGFFLYGQC